MAKTIYLLWASVRPVMLKETYEIWKNNMVTDISLIVKIATLTEEMKEEIESFNIENCTVQVVTEKGGYNFAITKLTKELEANDDDIVVTLSDDFHAPKEWDKFLLDKFSAHDGALFLDDGYQIKKVKEGECCITLGCLTFGALKKLNKIVFHPSYNHYFSDNEAFRNFKELGILQDTRDTDNKCFYHTKRHRKSDKYDERTIKWWDEDQINYQARMILPIEERLK